MVDDLITGLAADSGRAEAFARIYSAAAAGGSLGAIPPDVAYGLIDGIAEDPAAAARYIPGIDSPDTDPVGFLDDFYHGERMRVASAELLSRQLDEADAADEARAVRASARTGASVQKCRAALSGLSLDRESVELRASLYRG